MLLAILGEREIFQNPNHEKELNIMSLDTLQDLFIDEIKDLYSAEKQLTKALPKMAKSAENQELKEGFERHLEETEGQIERLEKVFEVIGMKPKAKTCKA